MRGCSAAAAPKFLAVDFKKRDGFLRSLRRAAELGDQQRRRDRRRSAGRGGGIESEPSMFEALVQSRGGEAGEQGEEVTRPGIGPPRVDQESHFFAPI